MNKWFQEGSPNSYKIQVLYQEIPQFVKTKPVDTPFRFASYEEAVKTGNEIFQGVQFKIVGSNDRPHWQSAPLEKIPIESLSKKSWYDLYAVSPAVNYEINQASYQQKQKFQAAQSVEDINFKALQALKTIPNSPGLKSTKLAPPPLQRIQYKQTGQKGQASQKGQKGQASQKGQKGQTS